MSLVWLCVHSTHRLTAAGGGAVRHRALHSVANNPPLATCLLPLPVLQEVISSMYILSPHDNPSQDWQAVSRLLRTGQKSDTVTVRSFIMLHTPAEDSFVRQARKTRCFEFYHGYDIRDMLDLPMLEGGEEVGQQAGCDVSKGSDGGAGRSMW